jgi:hypothetical protein
MTYRYCIKKLFALFVCFGIFLMLAAMGYAQQIDQATGGGVISADNFASGAYTSLSGPVITETNVGQLIEGNTIRFTAPAGYQWDTGGANPAVAVEKAPGFDKKTKLEASFTSRTATQITFTIDKASKKNGARLTFSNFRVRPTKGTVPNTDFITNTGTTAPGGQTNYGDLVMVAGAPTKIRVETKANGTGVVVPAQNITAGNSLTVFSVSRDQFNNYVANTAADSWSIINGTDGVTSADITPAGDSKSATFSSTDTGTGKIQAVKSGRTPTASGTITVKAAAPSALTINTQPSATATAGQNFAQQPVIHVVDVFGNRVKSNNSIQITAARAAGSGTLQGTKTLTVAQGAATYTNLKHNVANTISIQFSASGFSSVTSSDITVNAAAASKLGFTTQPQKGSRNNALNPGPTVQIQDTFGNSVSQSGTNITITKASGPGSIRNNSTTQVATNTNGAAVFDNLSLDTNGSYTIQAAASGLTSVTSNTFQILNSGELANFEITTTSDAPIGSQTAGQTFTIKIKALDGTGSLLDGSGQPEYTRKALVFSTGNTGTGLSDNTANFSGGEVTHTVALENAGDFTISVTGENASGSDITSQSNGFTVNPAAADPGNSTISAAPDNIVANGSSTSLITVQLTDQFGNQLNSGGDNVTISTDAGILTGSVTDNGDGTYEQSLQSSTTAAPATVSATVNGDAITSGNATVNFVAGGLDHFAVEKAGGATIGTQDAGQAFNIRIIAQDVNNNTVTSFNGSVTITSSNTISSGGGTASLTNGILSSRSVTITEAGQNNVTLSAANTSGTQSGISNSFTVNPGPTDPAVTTITPANNFIENTGSSTTVITVQAKDQFGNNRLSGGQTVTLSTTAGTLQGSVADNGDGTYTQSLQSSTTITSATITGTIAGTNISDDAVVTFTEFNTWLGDDKKTDWDDTKFWSLNQVPTPAQAVIIPTNPVDGNTFPIIFNNQEIAFLQIDNTATVNVTSGITLTVTVDIIGQGTLIGDQATMVVGDDIKIANLTAGTSTITLNGSSPQEIPGALLSDVLNIENTGEGITTGGSITTNTLNINSSPLNMKSGSTLEVFGDVAGTDTLTADNTDITIGGNVSVSTVDVTTSDVTFNGTAGQTISNIADYRNLTISNTTAAGVTLNNTTNVSQALTINGGAKLTAQENLSGSTINATGGTLRLAKNVSFANVTSAPATVEFFGGNPQAINGFNPFNNLTVDKSSERLESSSDVVVNGTLSLTNGDLVMGSGTNLLAPNRSLSGGTIRFQLILPTPGFYSISSPVASTYTDFLDSIVTQGYPGAFYSTGSAPGDTLQPSVLYYDETFPGTDNQRYRTIGNATNTVEEARGHFVFVFGDIAGSSLYNRPTPDTLEIGGPEFTGDGSEVNFDVTYTAEADTGFNLVGNPYGATIDWDDDANFTKTNMDNTIYVWDKSANGGNGDYLVWNGFTGSLGDGLIAPFQAFWVKANAQNPVLKVQEDAKTVGGVFRTKRNGSQKNERHPFIELKLNSGNLETKSYISFSENADRGKDNRDAYRLTPFTNTFLELFSTFGDGTQLTINNLPRQFGKIIEIPLFVGGFNKGNPINDGFTLSWPELNSIPSEWSITLIDQKTGEEIDFSTDSFYSFDVNTARKLKSNTGVQHSMTIKTKSKAEKARFILQINPGGDAGDIPSEVTLSQNFPNPFSEQTTIKFGVPLQTNVSLTIYDILGRKVDTIVDKQYQADFHTEPWSPNSLASGVYLFVLRTDEKILSKKLTYIK